MQVTRNVFTISDLSSWIDEKALVVNSNYQRSAGLWPLNARSYLIDTILNGYPFPKVIIRQSVNLKTRKSVREIIDGQQRLMAINDFIHSKIALSKASKNFAGATFNNLDEETQERFLAYEVSVDTIIASTEDQTLEIFRRMNSFMLPLNEAERRHASWQGEFKWFIVDLINKYTPLLESYEIFTLKQIARMGDADLFSELCQILDVGIQSRRKTAIEGLYKKYDTQFARKDEFLDKLTAALDFIKVDLNAVCAARVLKGYSFYSLFSALVYNRWGVPNLEPTEVGIEPIGQFCPDKNSAEQIILELFNAVDRDDIEGQYKDFVRANKRATPNRDARLVRLKYLAAALQGRIVGKD